MRAEQDGIEIDLRLDSGKPPVLQGDMGLSQKGEQSGNASYYYSLTRLPSSGSLRIGEESLEVIGSSWMDREWSTSALEEGQVGWDWFALQLSDERDLMLYRMRLKGDRTAPQSNGVIVEAAGGHRRLEAGDFTIEVSARWRSPETGILYPAAWHVVSPAAGVDLTLTPLLAAQEHVSSVFYWEGAVDIRGTSNDRPVEGHGYVELTGYGKGASAEGR